MVSVIIPLYNAVSYLPTLLEKLRQQTLSHELILIDSESSDGTSTWLTRYQIPYHSIPKSSFNHGGTRNLGASLATFDLLVFMTQDALPASNETLANLVACFNTDTEISMAYGRQLPYPDADTLSQFARLHNYPPESQTKSIVDIARLGIKTCHCSNSFAVYRKQDLLSVGGFPEDTILGEDVTVAAQLILNGKKLAYCANAVVYHSHNYTLIEEFKRYFDIGVFHKQQYTILSQFSVAESAGFSYVLREWAFLIQQRKPLLIPIQILRTISKYIGYRMGRSYQWWPIGMKQTLSMHPSFWLTQSLKAELR
jgi:rhamnosyltransferase